MPLPLDPRRSVLPLLLQHHRAWFTIVAYECRYRCACREVLLKDPSLVELRTDAQVVVVGDLHGQYQDLQRIFERLGRPGSDPKVWVFLGDYIDRGEAGDEGLWGAGCMGAGGSAGGDGDGSAGGDGGGSAEACLPAWHAGPPDPPSTLSGALLRAGPMGLEIVATLLALKLRHPTQVFMLRGNHECSEITVGGGQALVPGPSLMPAQEQRAMPHHCFAPVLQACIMLLLLLLLRCLPAGAVWFLRGVPAAQHAGGVGGRHAGGLPAAAGLLPAVCYTAPAHGSQVGRWLASQAPAQPSRICLHACPTGI